MNQSLPLLDGFNYVVALVPLADGTDLLVDATEPLLPCGVLPPRYEARRTALAAPLADPAATWSALGAATHVVVHTRAWPDDTGTRVRAWLESQGARVVGTAEGAWLYALPPD